MTGSRVYLRREPTSDPLLIAHNAARLDVVAYADAACAHRVALWPWHRTRPDRRHRHINLNCVRHAVVWLPDAFVVGAA